MFIGGDPLAREDFVELVDHITGRHGAKARFFFNSRVDAALARRLRKAGRGRLTPLASIDGPREINDALRGDGSYDDVMTSMANLLADGHRARWPTPCSCGRRCPACRSSRASCVPPGSAGCT